MKKLLKKKILVVDDEECLRYIISRVISSNGFSVDTAVNGEEALIMFLNAAYDVVVTDFQMPEMDGLSLARKVKTKSPGTPVVMITGVDKNELPNDARKNVDFWLTKPFRLIDLQNLLSHVFHTKTPGKDKRFSSNRLLS